jgi:hypothetical protein
MGAIVGSTGATQALAQVGRRQNQESRRIHMNNNRGF